jgi:hypothetical protein
VFSFHCDQSTKHITPPSVRDCVIASHHVITKECLERIISEEDPIPEGTRPIGRPGHRRKANIKMDFKELGCGRMNSTGSE